MAEHKPRTRQEAAVAWASSHAGELAGVTVPLAAGAVVSPWVWLLSAGVAGVWARHEVLLARRTRAARHRAVGSGRAPRLPAASHGREQDPSGGPGRDETAPGSGRPHRREVSR
ncbi:hypothetical protein [Amycolatopsis keratiniphila]|uniref:hypothetical protein n=1 Tax=Amycolatopsis keratiniphila TaxID=129921 RepID=UPI00087D297A|nr:hypothetical protein [Amycolatopsis keratiniphila]OLZ56091.1 hypothetical protein BS330_18345 [Amycolatopsis keratiniphila subsp. nogabecina]SDU51726.1 hypothetical protein SAMN04489733_5333 [Amycolatopsis keratiniphila]